MKGLKRIAAVIAGTGLITLVEVAVAQTVLAQIFFPVPSFRANDFPGILVGNPTSIATVDGQTFYITENNRRDLVSGEVQPGIVGRFSLSDIEPTVPPFAGGTSDPTQFGSNSPNGVAVDLMGRVYVADTGNNEIDILDSSGTSLPGLAGYFNNPNGVAVNLSNGNIYVADTGNNEVDIFNSSLVPLDSLRGYFNNPNRVAVNPSNGNIYVPDSGNNEVDIFNSNLEPLDSLRGFFNNPADVAVDSFGNVSVLDAGNNEVDLFDSSLQLNSSIDGFTNPTGLTVDSSGRVYVLDAGPGATLELGSSTSIVQLETTPVPESSSALGILAFGAMGAGYMLKRKLKK